MLRLILRLRPSAGRARPRALPAGPAALGCGSVPGTSCLRRFHTGSGSRTVSLGSTLGHRRALLRYPPLTARCRFYSLPPHQKVTYRTGSTRVDPGRTGSTRVAFASRLLPGPHEVSSQRVEVSTKSVVPHQDGSQFFALMDTVKSSLAIVQIWLSSVRSSHRSKATERGIRSDAASFCKLQMLWPLFQLLLKMLFNHCA